MVNKLSCLLLPLAMLLIIPTILAEDTPITIISYPNHSITVNVLDPSSGDAFASMSNMTDSNGQVTLTFYSPSRKEIALYFLVRKDGKLVFNKKDEGSYVTGNAISFDLRTPEPTPTPAPVPEPVQENTTETENNSAPAEEITEEVINDSVSVEISEDSKLTGSAATTEKASISEYSKYIYYIIGALVLALIVFFLIRKVSFLKPGFFKPQKFNSSQAYSPPARVEITDKQLLNAEKRIKEVEEEIGKIKAIKQRKLDAERKFEEAKKELERIRKEEEK